MADDGGKSPQEGTGDVVQALKNQLPQLIQTIIAQYDPAAGAELEVARKYSPQIAQVQADTLGNQGKQLAKIGRDISSDEARQAAETEAEIAAGPGRKITQATVDAQQLADPEYYASRKVMGDAIGKLLGFDPNKLSPGEEESVARGIGRTAGFVPSATETAKNAMVFGDALSKRRSEFGSAVSQAANATNALRGPVSATETTARRQVLPNVGTQAYTGVQTPGVGVANQQAGGLQGTATTAMSVNMQKELSDWDKFMKGLGAVDSTIGTIGSAAKVIGGMGICWVARAVYGETDPRWLVFRNWLCNDAPYWLYRLYARHGESFAHYVRRWPLLRRAVKFAMDFVTK